MRLPGLSGREFFLHPLGIVNGASFAPAAIPSRPENLSRFLGRTWRRRYNRRAAVILRFLAESTVTINNLPAPISRISSTQINALVPYGIAGSTATIVVNNNGQTSNSFKCP